MRRKIWRMVKKITESARRAMVLDAATLKWFDISQVVARGRSLPSTLFNVFSDEIITVRERNAKQGVKEGKIRYRD